MAVMWGRTWDSWRLPWRFTTYADARAATNDADYEARMKAYARLISEDAASDWLYTRKCFTVASTKVSGYPTSMINRRMPLAGLTVK